MHEITFDEDDDINERSIIYIIDAQFNQGRVPQIKSAFDNKRRQHLKNENQDDYIQCVVKYDRLLAQELDINMDTLCDQYGITKEDINRSSDKYLNNTNSNRVLGQDEVLRQRVPKWLTQSEARKIVDEMKQFAKEKQDMFFTMLVSQESDSDKASLDNSGGKRLNGKKLLDKTYEPEEEPGSIAYKSTILAKYLTLDEILDKRYKISEPILKRALYKAYFDAVEKQQSFLTKFSKLLFK